MNTYELENELRNLEENIEKINIGIKVEHSIISKTIDFMILCSTNFIVVIFSTTTTGFTC